MEVKRLRNDGSGQEVEVWNRLKSELSNAAELMFLPVTVLVSFQKRNSAVDWTSSSATAKIIH